MIAIAIPVKLGSKQSMACGWNLQFQYAEATNITQLQVYPPIIAKSRERRSNYISDRRLAYLTIENMIDRYDPLYYIDIYILIVVINRLE